MIVLIINDWDNHLIERYYLEMNDELMGVAYSILRSHFEAEAAVQEAFTRIMTSIESFRKVPDEKKNGYCYMVVKNISINMYNKSKQTIQNVILFEDTFVEVKDNGESIETYVEKQEDIAELNRLINDLDDSFRRPLMLRFANGFSCKQISDILGISESLARKRVERAIIKLTEISKKDGELHGEYV